MKWVGVWDWVHLCVLLVLGVAMTLFAGESYVAATVVLLWLCGWPVGAIVASIKAKRDRRRRHDLLSGSKEERLLELAGIWRRSLFEMMIVSSLGGKDQARCHQEIKAAGEIAAEKLNREMQ